jgi:hypothetical protein
MNSNQLTNRFFVTILLMLQSSCNGGLPPEHIPAPSITYSHSQCEGRSSHDSDNTESVQSVVRTLVPPASRINCTDLQPISVDGKTIELVFVAFGKIHDCPAGCFSNYLCAIYDGQTSILYSQPGRRSARETERLGHPLAHSADFDAFKQSQVNSQGPWRFCFLGQ